MNEIELWIVLGVLVLIGLAWLVANRGPKTVVSRDSVPVGEEPDETVSAILKAVLDAVAAMKLRTGVIWQPAEFHVNPDCKALDWFKRHQGADLVPPYASTTLAPLLGIPIRPNQFVPSMMLMYQDQEGKLIKKHARVHTQMNPGHEVLVERITRAVYWTDAPEGPADDQPK